MEKFLQNFTDKFFPAKVTPNDITTLRLILTIPLLYTLLKEYYFVCLIVFAFAALLDAFDGPLARKRKLVTDQGKLWDPITDKILVLVPVLTLLLAEDGTRLNSFLVAAIFITETILIFIATGKYLFPQLMPQRKLGSNVFGKIKMNLQCCGVIMLILVKILISMRIVDFSVIADWVAHSILIIATVFAVSSILGHLFGWGEYKPKI